MSGLFTQQQHATDTPQDPADNACCDPENPDEDAETAMVAVDGDDFAAVPDAESLANVLFLNYQCTQWHCHCHCYCVRYYVLSHHLTSCVVLCCCCRVAGEPLVSVAHGSRAARRATRRHFFFLFNCF